MQQAHGREVALVSDKVESGDIEVKHCATENMLTDVLTKPLLSARHNKLGNAILGLPL
jgi:hypothetical protein